MPRCPYCDYPLPDDRERVGARCPRCHDPLYETPERIGRPAREGEGQCAAHPGIETVGTCARCGNYLCEVCRTRWRGQILCAECVNRALESDEATPEQVRAHFRQALLSVLFGVGAWVLSVLALVVVGAAGAAGTDSSAVMLLLVLGFLVLAGDTVVAALGVGQAVAALRTRGNHMILATVGLILSGLYVGMFLGLMNLSFWMS
jgi:hypothetical protein